MKSGPVLCVRETDESGRLRLTVVGELDLSTVERFEERVEAARQRHAAVRLDLSRLEFIDCVGLAAVIRAVRAGGEAAVEVERPFSREVDRLIELLGPEGLEELASV